MPWVNYCKKCKREVPPHESCSECGAKLAKTNERLSFWVRRIPVRDWFSWNQVLRIALPALLLVMIVVLLAEGIASGGRGIQLLFVQGFFWVLISALGIMLFVMLVVLLLQGEESISFLLDKNGLHAYTYVPNGTTIKLLSRFLTRESAAKMVTEELALPGWTLVRKVDILWPDVRRIRFWYETRQILVFRPNWWQALVLTCPPGDFEEAETYVRKKLGRNKKVRIIPQKARSKA